MQSKRLSSNLKNKFTLKKINNKKNILQNRNIYTSKDVHKLIINRNKLLGQGAMGEIYSGIIVFKDKKTNKHIRKRVAIKEFKENFTNQELNRYKEGIKTLSSIKLKADKRFPNRKVGYSTLIPKMGLVKINGKWVLVTQSFSRKGKSKFYSNNYFNIKNLSKSEKVQFLKESSFILTKIIEKGYDAIDSLIQFKNHSSSVIPLDLDTISFSKRNNNAFKKAELLIENLNVLAYDLSLNKKNYNIFLKKLLNYSLNSISDKNMKKEYKKIYKERYKKIVNNGYKISY
jgi:hypothetical protein